MNEFILTLNCSDGRGMVSSFATDLVELEANIIASKQLTDHATNTFVILTDFEDHLDDPQEIIDHLASRVHEFGARFRVPRVDDRSRVMIPVSKDDHCLLDVLNRHHSGELAAHMSVVVFNHQDLRDIVERDGIEFRHVLVSPETRVHGDEELLSLIEEFLIHLGVLARHMQTINPNVCDRLAGRIIDIHHSFLPGIKDGWPYHQAWERGGSSSARPRTTRRPISTKIRSSLTTRRP